jgi:hypothetical protein
MSLDAEWRRLTRTSRARQALKQLSIAHPALRGLADLDELLEQRCDDQAAPAILRALALLAPDDDLAARALLQGAADWSASPGLRGHVVECGWRPAGSSTRRNGNSRPPAARRPLRSGLGEADQMSLGVGELADLDVGPGDLFGPE